MKAYQFLQNKSINKKLNKKYVCGIGLTLLGLWFIITFKHGTVRNLALCVVNILGGQEKIFLKFIRSNTSFIGSAVWTLTTILAAFIILYYGSLGYKNYGIPNRKIIAYTCGTWFLPGVAALNALIVIWMTWAYYCNLYTQFYLLCGYSFFFTGNIDYHMRLFNVTEKKP